MRGQRAWIAKKKVDLVLVAVRYQDEDERLAFAQGYERRGDVWSDLMLFGRDDIVARVQSGDRIFTGRLSELEGDFELSNRIQLKRGSGDVRLHVGDNNVSGDDLDLPLF